jgi:hypothetical protein
MYASILILSLISSFLGCTAFTVFTVYVELMDKKRREFYTFISEEGEEIPIGI